MAQMRYAIPVVLIGAALAAPAAAADPFFSTGSPDGLIGTVSQPATGAKFEIETADDFVLTAATEIDSATFTGLVTGNMNIGEVRVEIYQVFPAASNVARTS